MSFLRFFTWLAALVTVASIVYLLVSRRRRLRSTYVKPLTMPTGDGGGAWEGTGALGTGPAQAQALSNAAKAVAASQQAVQRVAVANGSAAKAAQGYSTAASRAQARQQAARKATVPPVPPKPVHVRSGPQRTFQGSTAQPQNLPRQEDDSGLLGLAVASTVLDDLASIQVPDIDISPSSDSISQDFSGDGGDFGGGGSTGEW